MPDASATGQVGNPACGDVMNVFIKIKGDKIVDASVQTYGCVAAIAASDALCEIAIGKTIAEAEKLTFKNVLELLGEVPQIKVHCSQLGIEALREAIKNYKNGVKPNEEASECAECPMHGSCGKH